MALEQKSTEHNLFHYADPLKEYAKDMKHP
jgi:hypothetical protein